MGLSQNLTILTMRPYGNLLKMRYFSYFPTILCISAQGNYLSLKHMRTIVNVTKL